LRVEVGSGIRLYVDILVPTLSPDGRLLRERPTLVLLHGAGMDHSWFRPGFEELSDLAQLVCVDQRGHGRSDRCPPAEYTFANYADDVRRVCDGLGIDHPMVLGSSFGGQVAMAYAARHPDHPAGLILSSTAPRRDLESTFRAYSRLGGEEVEQAARRYFAEPDDPDARKDYGERCLPLSLRFTWSEDQLARVVAPDPEAYAGIDGDYDLRPELAKVRCPVLVIAGEEDPLTPAELAAEIVAALPEGLGTLERVPQAGHGVCRDAQEVFFRLVREFIGRLAAA
jgi:pimeloyl-ACP methyl ester carboxylesterase